MPMSKSVDLGKVIDIDGVPCKRILSSGAGVSAGVKSMCRGYPKVSVALPRHCEGAEHVKSGRLKGAPIIQNRRHEENLCKMHGYSRDLDF